MDAHAEVHAAEIRRRFASGPVTTGVIAWFGFSAGLLPCPAAIAVLLICLQLKNFALGVAMVAAFGAGLAVTLVAIGVIAAWGATTASDRYPWLDQWAGRLPYISAAILLVIGSAVLANGVLAFSTQHSIGG